MKNRSLIYFCGLIILFSASFAGAATKKLLVLGDSLTEGYGVAQTAAFPALLEKKIQSDKKDWVVINGGISGSTSASALSRLQWQLKAKPDLILLALGANDGLRGLKTSDMEGNLAKAIEAAQMAKVPVILVGMMMPPNYSKVYAADFKAVFLRLAKRYHLKLIPFLLQDVGGIASLNQPDGIHPNEKGHQIIADHLYQELKSSL